MREEMTGGSRHSRRLRWVRVAGSCILVAAASCLVLLAGRWMWQGITATEGDVPSVEQMHFPPGTDVLSEERECGSGGCTAIFVLRPPPESTASEMLTQYSELYEGGIPGSLFDLRTVAFVADLDPDAGTVRVAASLWSSSPLLPLKR